MVRLSLRGAMAGLFAAGPRNSCLIKDEARLGVVANIPGADECLCARVGRPEGSTGARGPHSTVQFPGPGRVEAATVTKRKLQRN